MFQQSVSPQAGAGVVGEFYDTSPRRVRGYIADSVDPANNVVGRAFFQGDEDNLARAGGTGVFCGILVDPKQYAAYGTALGGTLAPTLTVPNGTQISLCTMGHPFVNLPEAAAIGDLITYSTTTGELGVVSASVGFTGVIAVTTGILTVSALEADAYLTPGAPLTGANVPAGTIITSQLTGTAGQAGTYQTNITTAVASTAMTAPNGALASGAGYAFLPNAEVFGFTVTEAGLAVIELTN